MSLESLSDQAQVLQTLLAFFDPELIPERLIVETKAQLANDRLNFLFDRVRFDNAITELTRATLVTRVTSSKVLSVDRLTQLSVFDGLSPKDRVFYFDTVVQILSYNFPNTWNDRGPHQGHGYEAWATCGAVLPHINWLIFLVKERRVKPANSMYWAELIFRAGTYLWEKDQPTLAFPLFEFGLLIDIDKTSVVAAQAHRLMGHILLDLARPRAALDAYKEALAIRQHIEAPESPPIADVYDSIACSLIEIGDVGKATQYLAKAMSIHEAHDPRKRSRTEAIRAMAFLRAEQPREALEALRACWKLQGLTQEQIEASKYPKHSGDIVLLARVCWMEEDKDRAQELMSRTIDIRRALFEHGSPRVAGSIFQLAHMLQAREEYDLAAKLLREIIDISSESQDTKGYLARALWFLAGIEEKLDSPDSECVQLKERARRERGLIVGRESSDDDTNESFMALVSWILW
ncbi:hypothetical protein F5B20DRAFT_577646 [Whalleya microplaca]|nr:hypothetical protein F5B20DRAFT_577646 [Whalleya microplaca]